MALNLQDKQAIVAEVNEAAKGALSAVIADSRGVTVDKMTELRKAAREAGALGAKLTGGGVGGAMLALAKDDTDAHRIMLALEAAGAQEVWSQQYPQI